MKSEPSFKPTEPLSPAGRNGELSQEILSLSDEERELFRLLLEQEGVDVAQMILARAAPGAALPLSFTQERLWNISQLAGDSRWGNLPLAFRITGPLDPPSLDRSLAGIVHRHAILRSTFAIVEGRPSQIIHGRAVVALRQLDLRHLKESQRQDRAVSELREEARRPFVLDRDPLLRALLILLGPEDSILLLTTHHFVTDGWSIRCLLLELSAGYRAALAGVPSPVQDPPIQFADFAVWQREWLTGSVLDEQVRYWKQQLRDAPREMDLPIDRARTAGPSFKGAAQSFKCPGPLGEGLRELSAREGVTMFVTLLAAWQAVLRAYCRQDDLVVGTPISNRIRKETENLIGNFANNLLLRVRFTPELTFSALLRQVHATVMDAFAHQDLPLEKLMSEENAASAIRVPPVQCMFIVRDGSVAECVDFPGVTADSISVELGAAVVDLNLDITQSRAGLSGILEYRTELFDRKTVEGMVTNYVAFLETAVARPDLPLEQVLRDLPVSTARGAAHASAGAAPKQRNGYKPPNDDIEERLAEIWQRILQVPCVGVRDNFFELGGFSLLAVRLFAEIEKVFESKLPLATLLQAPTVEQLAAVLRGKQKPATWSSLVPIRPEGTRTPLFLVHAIGGNLLTYRDLVDRLHADQPVYGLQSRGLDGTSCPRTSVEEMAKAYLQEIREVQPCGPYLLGGTSFGGVVAYEMARQLVSVGERVELVALLDAYHLRYEPEEAGLAGYQHRLSGYWQRLSYHFVNLVLRRNRFAYVRKKVGIAARRLGRKFRNRTWEVAHRYYQMTGRPLPPVLHQVNDANHFALREYSPAPYPGRVTLFRSTELSIAHKHNPELAWRHLVRSMEIHDVPGDHVTSMFEPHVSILAQKLQFCLDRAQNPEVGEPSSIATVR